MISKLIQKAQSEERRSIAPPKGWVPWILPTSLWIHDYLMEVKEAYPFEIYRGLGEARKILSERSGYKYHVPSYVSFYKHVYCLEKLGLIRRTGRTEPSMRGPGGETRTDLPRKLWRKYYEIAPRKERITNEWLNPQKALARIKKWRIKKIG